MRGFTAASASIWGRSQADGRGRGGGGHRPTVQLSSCQEGAYLLQGLRLGLLQNRRSRSTCSAHGSHSNGSDGSKGGCGDGSGGWSNG